MKSSEKKKIISLSNKTSLEGSWNIKIIFLSFTQLNIQLTLWSYSSIFLLTHRVIMFYSNILWADDVKIKVLLLSEIVACIFLLSFFVLFFFFNLYHTLLSLSLPVLNFVFLQLLFIKIYWFNLKKNCFITFLAQSCIKNIWK